MAKVGYLIQFTVNDGQWDAFKTMADGFVAAVQDNEPNTKTYQWFEGTDQKSALLLEQFADSDAMLTHLGNVGPSLPDLLAIAPITRLEVLGDVSEAAREALAPLGAVHFSGFCGFER